MIVGRIRRAHGIRGEVVVEVLTEAPDAIFASGARLFAGSVDGDLAAGAPELHVASARPFQDLLLVAFDEIPDRTVAERWRDRHLLVPESEVDAPAEDEVFIHDLVGLMVELSDGRRLGRVAGTFEVAGKLLLEVSTEAGAILLPYEMDFIDEVDVPGARLRMTLPDGMLE